MKTKLSIIAVLTALTTFAEVEPSDISIEVKVTGSLTQADRRTIRWIVDKENLILEAPLLPRDTNADLKTSLEAILTRISRNYVTNSAATAALEAERKLTPEERATVMRAITDKLNSGKTASQIEEAIKALP